MPALRCSQVLRFAFYILVTSAIFASQSHAQNRPAGQTKIGRIKAVSGRVPPGSPPQDQLSYTVFWVSPLTYQVGERLKVFVTGVDTFHVAVIVE